MYCTTDRQEIFQVTNYQYQPSLQFTSEHLSIDIDPELLPISEQVVAVDSWSISHFCHLWLVANVLSLCLLFGSHHHGNRFSVC